MRKRTIYFMFVMGFVIGLGYLVNGELLAEEDEHHSTETIEPPEPADGSGETHPVDPAPEEKESDPAPVPKPKDPPLEKPNDDPNHSAKQKPSQKPKQEPKEERKDQGSPVNQRPSKATSQGSSTKQGQARQQGEIKASRPTSSGEPNRGQESEASQAPSQPLEGQEADPLEESIEVLDLEKAEEAEEAEELSIEELKDLDAFVTYEDGKYYVVYKDDDDQVIKREITEEEAIELGYKVPLMPLEAEQVENELLVNEPSSRNGQKAVGMIGLFLTSLGLIGGVYLYYRKHFAG